MLLSAEVHAVRRTPSFRSRRPEVKIGSRKLNFTTPTLMRRKAVTVSSPWRAIAVLEPPILSRADLRTAWFCALHHVAYAREFRAVSYRK